MASENGDGGGFARVGFEATQYLLVSPRGLIHLGIYLSLMKHDDVPLVTKPNPENLELQRRILGYEQVLERYFYISSSRLFAV